MTHDVAYALPQQQGSVRAIFASTCKLLVAMGLSYRPQKTTHSDLQHTVFAAHLDWCQAALVEWDVSRDKAAQAVDDCTVRHRRGCVQVAIHLWPSASEIKCG